MIIKYELLPVSIHGFITRKVEPDGEYDTIILNARDSDRIQRQTFEHEMNHRKYGHFDDDRPIDIIEQEAENGR